MENKEEKIDSVLSAYLKEISKYPLLDDNEEKRLTKILNNKNNLKLLLIKKKKNVNVYHLNLPLLFLSLINNNSYKDIIDNLISLYNELNKTNNKELYILEKYKGLSNALNRPLNNDELLKYFNINSNIYETINESLFDDTKDFIEFMKTYNKMFVSNLRLVISIINKNKGPMKIMDLVSDGNVGLMKAIDDFDITRGNKFSTYAIWWITCYVQRSVLSQNSRIKLPENIYNDLNNFKKDVELLEREEGRHLSSQELSIKLSLPYKTVCKYQELLQEFISLDMPVAEDNNSPLLEFIPSETDEYENVYKSTLEKDINVLFKDLDERETKIIKMHFGLGEYKNKEKTLIEISKLLSLSHQRIRQIETKALYKMKRSTKNHNDCQELMEYMHK